MEDKISLHQGSQGKGSSEGIDVDTLIKKSECSDEYYRLEDCLLENKRSWTKCQHHVKLLKECKLKMNENIDQISK